MTDKATKVHNYVSETPSYYSGNGGRDVIQYAKDEYVMEEASVGFCTVSIQKYALRCLKKGVPETDIEKIGYLAKRICSLLDMTIPENIEEIKLKFHNFLIFNEGQLGVVSTFGYCQARISAICSQFKNTETDPTSLAEVVVLGNYMTTNLSTLLKANQHHIY